MMIQVILKNCQDKMDNLILTVLLSSIQSLTFKIMHKISLFLLLISSTLLVKAQINVEPAFWWSGMAETELQLMVSGDNIADYVPAVTSKHVTIREVVTLEN
ncbi:MAG: cyclomaltodextrinase N-terminal domain-containing protein, partial [Proteiniphilum sp.]|nr:cyclomaltodextrinase N-terminal domain-containing protein [Proteiniphilum sp.]